MNKLLKPVALVLALFAFALSSPAYAGGGGKSSGGGGMKGGMTGGKFGFGFGFGMGTIQTGAGGMFNQGALGNYVIDQFGGNIDPNNAGPGRNGVNGNIGGVLHVVNPPNNVVGSGSPLVIPSIGTIPIIAPGAVNNGENNTAKPDNSKPKSKTVSASETTNVTSPGSAASAIPVDSPADQPGTTASDKAEKPTSSGTSKDTNAGGKGSASPAAPPVVKSSGGNGQSLSGTSTNR